MGEGPSVSANPPYGPGVRGRGTAGQDGPSWILGWALSDLVPLLCVVIRTVLWKRKGHEGAWGAGRGFTPSRAQSLLEAKAGTWGEQTPSLSFPQQGPHRGQHLS